MVTSCASIDDYVATFPADVQAVLERVRATIHEEVPDAGEAIRYAMPTITLDGRALVHFAAWKRHLALYPTPAGDGPLQRRLAPYSSGKGSTRFPWSEPFPYDLLRQVIALLLVQRGD
ncbi:MAG: DUF1801 domain-containing protein [Geodermatophilaceae bacterium]|nr:DUF1801 domain-containing protein [Geodermatophilaceae bacterium]